MTLPASSPSTAGNARVPSGADLESLFDETVALLAVLDGSSLRFTAINRTFAETLGTLDALGQTWDEVFVDGAYWRSMFEHVLRSGENLTLRALRPPGLRSGAPIRDGCFIDWVVQPLRQRSDGVLSILMQGNDVTDAFRLEREALLLRELEVELRELHTPTDIAQRAVSLLCAHLKVSRAVYAPVDPDQDRFDIIGEARESVVSALGTYRMKDFGDGPMQAMREGLAWVVGDVRNDPRVSAEDRRAYQALDMKAVVCVPLTRGGRFSAYLAVHADRPRVWHPREIELVVTVANRCLESIERARAEREARSSEERYRALLLGSAQIFWTAGPNGHVTEDSPTWRAFTGQTLEQWQGVGWLDALHPDDRREMSQKWVKAVERAVPVNTEYRLRHADGSWRWTSVRIVPIVDDDGRVRQWVGMNIDITARKLAERRDAFLLRLDDATRPLTDPAEIAQVVLKLICEELSADRATYFEIDEAQHAGHVVSDYSLNVQALHGTFPLEEYGHEFASAVRSGSTYQVDDIRSADLNPEQRARFAALQTQAELMVPLFKGGRLMATLGLFQSTPRAWQTDEEQLCHQVVQRCWDSLERARIERDVRLSDRRKDEFIATLAHELRNPLAPLRNSLALLMRPSTTVPTERLYAMMERQVDHLVHMVDDLLDVSRISRGMIELHSERVDLRDAMQHAIDTARPSIDAAGHHLCLLLPNERLDVQGDSVRLSQVFSNLLNNAAKYTPDGGQIEVWLEQQGDTAVARVRDNGIGIPPSMLTEVFEIFAQTPEGRHRGRGGLGIGLSLVKRLVSLHGGSVRALSDGAGQGSVFEVRLPVVRAPADTSSAETDRLQRSIDPLRLVVVDDNRDAADSIAMLLSSQSCDVRVAYDGAKALRLITQDPPDIALLDIGMPKMDGYELARAIRDAQGSAVTLVALTGWGQANDRSRSQAAGFDHHLVKPVSLEVLVGLLDQIGSTRR